VEIDPEAAMADDPSSSHTLLRALIRSSSVLSTCDVTLPIAVADADADADAVISDGVASR
jgi:hypothetical protein